MARVGSGGGSFGTGFTLTFASDAGTGADKLMVAIATPSDDITDVTFNGIACTFIEKDAAGHAQLWGLTSPSNGSHDVVVTNSGYHAMTACAQAYSDVADAPDAVNESFDGFSTDFSVAVTTITNNCWAFLAVRAGAVVNAGTGSNVAKSADDGLGECVTLLDSNGAITPAGSYTMHATYPSPINFWGAMAAFGPFTGASGQTKAAGVATASWTSPVPAIIGGVSAGKNRMALLGVG